MEHKDILKLFFSRSYENQLNMNILDDIEYVIPIDGILNYVCEIISVPYSEYIEYINENPDTHQIESKHITQSSSFSACEREMVDAFLADDNRGLDYVGIGKLFPQYVTSANTGSYRKYGENQAKTAWQLGLLFEYFGSWYLNCIGYLYNELPEDDKRAYLARSILRDPLYNKIFRDLQLHDIDIISYMGSIDSNETKNRRYDSVKRLIDICLEACQSESIKMCKVLDTKTQLQALIKEERKKKSIQKALEMYTQENHQTESAPMQHDKLLKAAESYLFCDIEYYAQKFKSLHRRKSGGEFAPYKPILLLSVIELIEIHEISDNRIYESLPLKTVYANLIERYLNNSKFTNKSITDPYVHMDREGFWHFKYSGVTYQSPSKMELAEAKREYAYLDEELFNFLCEADSRDLLKKVLIDTYFTIEND